MGRRRVPSFFVVFSGFNAPGLINPFEIVDVHRVRRAADHEVAVGAGRAGDDDAVFARGTGLRVVEIERQRDFGHPVAGGRTVDEPVSYTHLTLPTIA